MSNSLLMSSSSKEVKFATLRFPVRIVWRTPNITAIKIYREARCSSASLCDHGTTTVQHISLLYLLPHMQLPATFCTYAIIFSIFLYLLIEDKWVFLHIRMLTYLDKSSIKALATLAFTAFQQHLMRYPRYTASGVIYRCSSR